MIVNSFMPSELPLMRARLETYFPEFLDHLEGDEEKQDARERAERIMELFGQVPTITDESLIPGTSLLREFIGGSEYNYH